MNTTTLCAETGLHRNTILNMVKAKELAATPVGGSHGYEFSADAPERVRKLLTIRHKERVALRRRQRDQQSLEN